MNVLILTSPEYKNFIADVAVKSGLTSDDVFMDWLNEEFIFAEPLTSWYDVGISFMYTHKVPAKEVKRHPWFNFHPAPLPEYKGRDLCYHAIMNREKEFGATIHYMDENFDTGDIVHVSKFEILPSDTAQEVSEMAIKTAKHLFQGYLPHILETPVFPTTPNKGGTYYKKGQIIEEVPVKPDSDFGEYVRAVSFPSKGFHPRIDIGGVKYKIVREE